MLSSMFCFAENWSDWHKRTSRYGFDYCREVDSIVIYMIDLQAVHFGRWGYRRDKFDEIYNHYSKQENEADQVLKIKMVRCREKMMFINMLNSMSPLDSAEVKVKPDEIVDTRENWLRGDGFGSNDPIDVNGKIIIYNNDGTQNVGFIENCVRHIDMFGWRFQSRTLQRVINEFYFSRYLTPELYDE